MVMVVKKRLYRSTNDVMIFGVCGGVAEYFDVDPTIVRLLWVFLTIGGMGIGLIMYIVMAIIVPKTPEKKK